MARGAGPDGAVAPCRCAYQKRFRLFDHETGRPLSGRKYRITTSGGQEITGVTDQDGNTEVVESDHQEEVWLYLEEQDTPDDDSDSCMDSVAELDPDEGDECEADDVEDHDNEHQDSMRSMLLLARDAHTESDAEESDDGDTADDDELDEDDVDENGFDDGKTGVGREPQNLNRS